MEPTLQYNTENKGSTTTNTTATPAATINTNVTSSTTPIYDEQKTRQHENACY